MSEKDAIPEFPPGSLGPVDEYGQYFRFIVHLITGWNHFEFVIAGILALLMNVPDKQILAMIYALNNSGARLDVIEKGLAPILHNHPRKDRIEKILKEARGCLKNRNTYAHAKYASVLGGGLVRSDWRYMSFGSRKHPVTTVNLSDLKIATDRFNAVMGDAQDVLAALVHARGAANNATPGAAFHVPDDEFKAALEEKDFPLSEPQNSPKSFNE